MKKYLSLAACLVSLAANAESVTGDRNLAEASASLQAMESSIAGAASTGALKPQQVIALNAKQHEIENLVQRLTARKNVTPDEYTAVKTSLKQQQARLQSYEQNAAPTRHSVDPSSLSSSTYVAPNGTTVVAPFGNTNVGAVMYSGSGAVTNPAPLMLAR